MLWLDQWAQVLLPQTMVLLSIAIFISSSAPDIRIIRQRHSTVLESGKDFTGPCHIMFTHEDASAADAYQQYIDAGDGLAAAGHMGVSRGWRLSYFPRISFNAASFWESFPLKSSSCDAVMLNVENQSMLSYSASSDI